ncbi:MAG TPA: CsbD family protein [Stellaceae bacterium]|nr:CsbD family protein [Stellaceae bacterium]
MRIGQAIAVLALASSVAIGAAHALDSDRVQGTGKELKGTVEQGAGAVTGDQKLQAQGQTDKSNGQLQDAWGKFKDSVRDITTSIENKFSGK